MKNFLIGVICFILGIIVCKNIVMQNVMSNIAIEKVESKGQEIDTALVTVNVLGEYIDYYMGE